MRTLFEQRFQVDLKDFDKILYATDLRKRDEIPLLNKRIQAFVDRKERLGK